MRHFVLSFFLATVALPVALWAQQAQPQRHNCGVLPQHDEQIKAQMLRNRAQIFPQDLQALRQSRNVRYVPVTVHFIGTSAGQYFGSPLRALLCICALNRDFADQNIQFYLHDDEPIRYLPDDEAREFGYSSSMFFAKVPNTMNIFVGSSAIPVAGYYMPGEDFIFLQTGEANLISRTLTHEAGHFFTLPHTFFGWEDINYDDVYAGAPAPVINGNGSAVEYAARTGTNANCSTAGDAFCDTEADYYSFRVDCNHRSTVLDPDSALLTPNNSYYMSYFGDDCMTTFSAEQKDAILASMTQRNWLNFPAPSLATITSASISAVAPAQADTVWRQANGSTLEFRWTASADAMGYILTLERMFMNQPVSTVFDVAVYDTTFSMSLNDLPNNGAYRWTVYPFGSYNACAALPVVFDFAVAGALPTNVGEYAAENSAAMSVICSPNPVSCGTSLRVEIGSAHAQSARMSLHDALGREWAAQRVELAASGDNVWLLPLDVPAGIYLLRIATRDGQQTRRIIVR